MARTKKCKVMVGDFETTVYKDQTHTEVWASACVELYTDDVKIFHSIEEQYNYFVGLNENLIVYYHNLKFDGSFWVDYLLKGLSYQQAFKQKSLADFDLRKMSVKEMPNKSFNYSISDMGQWYTITIKINNKIIEFRDSFKLLPFSVERIGKSFGTQHKKSSIEYKGLRYAGCEITQEERQYIANDVLVVKEALEIMFDDGHNALTIGSCCLHEYKNIVGKKQYEEWFPNIYEIPLDPEVYGSENAGQYIRKSYRGGWCYLAKGKDNKIKHNGTTADVNSLYPSMMHSESGNYYPVGKPVFWSGDYIPWEEMRGDYLIPQHTFFFVRIKTQFQLKNGMLPFIQVKQSCMYKATEMLETSDIYDKEHDIYHDEYQDLNGNTVKAQLIMTLTETDYNLFLKHYEEYNFQILDGCYFRAVKGLFDEYINKYREIKTHSKGAKRELAKLFLNNLYGKMATNTNSSFKYAFLRPDNSITFVTVQEEEKLPGYIPVGSAITSYARCFTINAAQANYYGPDKPGFIYADTDSIHCDLPHDKIKGITVHPTNFCCWKLEACWDTALFVRQKTYIEHVTHEDLEETEPYYSVRCAGMPERCKRLFLDSMHGNTHENDFEHYSEEELEFLSHPRELTDFKVGLKIPGKLMPKRIDGGILLIDTSYEMR